jgi:hypothetical protein
MKRLHGIVPDLTPLPTPVATYQMCMYNPNTDNSYELYELPKFTGTKQEVVDQSVHYLRTERAWVGVTPVYGKTIVLMAESCGLTQFYSLINVAR